MVFMLFGLLAFSASAMADQDADLDESEIDVSQTDRDDGDPIVRITLKTKKVFVYSDGEELLFTVAYKNGKIIIEMNPNDLILKDPAACHHDNN